MEYKIDIVVNKSSSGKYMERFLKSLDNQEYRNFRILIVEHIDGFTHTDEDTREIVYKDKPGKILLIRCGLQDNGWKIAYNKLDCNYVIIEEKKCQFYKDSLSQINERLNERWIHMLEFNYHMISKGDKRIFGLKEEYIQYNSILDRYVEGVNTSDVLFNKVIDANFIFEEDFIDEDYFRNKFILAGLFGRVSKYATVTQSMLTYYDDENETIPDKASSILSCENKIFDRIRFRDPSLKREAALYVCREQIKLYRYLFVRLKLNKRNNMLMKKQFDKYYEYLKRHERYYESLPEEEKNSLQKFYSNKEIFSINRLFTNK